MVRTRNFLRCLQIVEDPDTLAPSQAIDDVWHVHIINTPDYTAMCDRYFGKYIHHYIGHAKPGADMKANFQRFCALYRDTFHKPLEEWRWSLRDFFTTWLGKETGRRTVLIKR